MLCFLISWLLSLNGYNANWGDELDTVEYWDNSSVEESEKNIAVCSSTLLLAARGSHGNPLEWTQPVLSLKKNLHCGWYYLILCLCSVPILVPWVPFLLFQPWSKNVLRMSASLCKPVIAPSGTKPSPWFCFQLGCSFQNPGTPQPSHL